jgi:arylsulfatase A-like enzyme
MNIVLIALDTQRADHLGCYGYKDKTGRDTSPFIDSIAAQGVVFERCYAPNIPTHPSFTTMLTGKEAITHDIVNIGGGVPIKDGIRMIQEVLKEQVGKPAQLIQWAVTSRAASIIIIRRSGTAATRLRCVALSM